MWTLIWRHKRILGVGGVVGLLLVVVGTQTWAPASIDWEPVNFGPFPAWRAHDLVIQEQYGDTVWASRGFTIYRSTGDQGFDRMATIWPPLGEAWGGFFGGLRELYGRYDIMEVVALREDLAVAFAGGAIFRVDLAGGTVEDVFRLRYYGRGVGRGVMSRIAVDPNDWVYWGEYCRNKQKGPIAVYRGEDEGRTWRKVYEFAPGQVRHVHGLQWDPYGERLWIYTGDAGPECRIGYSLDNGKTFEWIGQGAQIWRTCSLLFSPNYVMWATDTGSAGNGNCLMCWDRATAQVRTVCKLPYQSIYAQSLGDGIGLVSMCKRACSVRLVAPGGRVCPIAEWGAWRRGESLIAGAIRGCRLPRGNASAAEYIYLNPMLTCRDQANIYRVPRHAVLETLALEASE